jgi:hypothetical protein
MLSLALAKEIGLVAFDAKADNFEDTAELRWRARTPSPGTRSYECKKNEICYSEKFALWGDLWETRFKNVPKLS